jgi:hypothetical protein
MSENDSTKVATRSLIHFPDLLAIRLIEDSVIRLYALIGAAVSLTAAGDLALFGVYCAAANQETKEAATNYYRYVQFEKKRDLTDASVRQLQSVGYELPQWESLLRDAQRILGKGERNLVGHNPVQSAEELWLTQNGEYHDFVVQAFVAQNQALVDASRRPAAVANEVTLLTYCQHAMTLCIRLERFAQRVRDRREWYRQVHGPESGGT